MPETVMIFCLTHQRRWHSCLASSETFCCTMTQQEGPHKGLSLSPTLCFPTFQPGKSRKITLLFYQLLSLGHSITATENKLRQVWSMQLDKYRCKWNLYDWVKDELGVEIWELTVGHSKAISLSLVLEGSTWANMRRSKMIGKDGQLKDVSIAHPKGHPKGRKWKN